jgi:arylsulfatase A-like enzyme
MTDKQPKKNDRLASALGIEVQEVQVEAQEVLPPVTINQLENVSSDKPEEPGYEVVDQREDYQLSRKTFRDLIDRGNGAIDGIADLARQSDSPRAYEVLATLMKTVAETTEQLFALQKKVKELNKDDSDRKRLDDTNINVERAVFVGSTAELLRKVKNNEDI